jgi:hypothetical protein
MLRRWKSPSHDLTSMFFSKKESISAPTWFIPDISGSRIVDVLPFSIRWLLLTANALINGFLRARDNMLFSSRFPEDFQVGNINEKQKNQWEGV